jgi:excisionase family DNA binding protein
MRIERRYLGAKDAARYLGFGDDEKGVNTVYQWVHRGKLPYVKIGRTLRFDVRALDALMQDHTRGEVAV